MRTIYGVMSAVIFAVAAAGLPAAPSDAGRPQKRETPAKLICRREQETGRIVPSRMCKTAAEWQRQGELAREMAQRVMDQGSINSCGGTTAGECTGGLESRPAPH